jgi:multiple sugar transport system substrate-binding protein
MKGNSIRFLLIVSALVLVLSISALSVTTIVFWHAYSETSGEVNLLMKTIIPDFEQLYPNIKVDAQLVPYDTMYQKLIVGVRSGVLPDVARMDIIWVPQFANAGILMPLNEQQFPGFDALKTQFYPGPLSTNFWKGSYYGLPLDTNTQVLCWNAKDFQEAGIQGPPKTMDEFINDIKLLTKKDASGKTIQWGYADGGVDVWNTLPWIYSMGGSILSPGSTTSQGYINSPASVKALQTYAQLYEGGYIAPWSGGPGTLEGLAQGTYAMTISGPWIVPILAGEYPNFKVNFALFPAGPGGSRSVTGGEDIVMFKNTKHPDAAWTFMKYMLSDKVQTEFAQLDQMSAIAHLASNPDYFKTNPYYAIYTQQLETAVARPPVPAYTKIDSILTNLWEAACTSGMPAQAALDSAAQQINQALAQQ